MSLQARTGKQDPLVPSPKTWKSCNPEMPLGSQRTSLVTDGLASYNSGPSSQVPKLESLAKWKSKRLPNQQVPQPMRLQARTGKWDILVSGSKTCKICKQEMLTSPEQTGSTTDALASQNLQTRPSSLESQKI